MDAKRLDFYFRKCRGDSPLTRTWSEFDVSEQSLLLAGTTFDTRETPVAGIADDCHRVLLTSEQIIWRTGVTTHAVRLAQILDVRAPEFGRVSKSDMRQLWIDTRDGLEYMIETPPGEPLFLLWNLLRKIIGYHDIELRKTAQPD